MLNMQTVQVFTSSTPGSVDALNEYTPFHPDGDIESRVPSHTGVTTRTADLTIESTSE